MSAEHNPPASDPLSQLEQALIDEFVRAQGYDPSHLSDLPDRDREALIKAASLYASGRLTEVEARSHFVHEIHEGPSIAQRHPRGSE